MSSTNQKCVKSNEGEKITPTSTKKRYSSVETKRLSKSTKNVLKNEKTNETISIPPIRDLNESSAADPDSKPFYHGNPFVEKHRGVMHLRKENLESSESSQTNNCCMLVMMDIPAFFTCRELVSFVRPSSTQILLMKIVRDETANKYMVAIKFKTPESAIKFYEQYNGIEFNSIEPEKCSLRFVDSIEAEDDSTTFTGLHADPAYGETPTCSVCLERMEEGSNMLLIILW
uniref:BRAP2 domain-containing protein n=1 Tax=Meloidogyne hapla TaxID=6305 RepID=A0A1I8BRH2_MELHA